MPTIREVMTPDPIALDAAATIQDAARVMRQYDVGDVLVTEGNQLCGVLTDRDIAVRAAAEGRDPQGTPIGAICTFGELEVVAPSDPVEVAVERMRTYAVRRLPVIDPSGELVGIVSIGDLAVESDPDSALADISVAEPNR